MNENGALSRRNLFVPRSSNKEPKTVEMIPIPGVGTVRLVSSAHVVSNTPEELGAAQAIGLETGQFSVYGDIEEAREGISKVLSHMQYKQLLSEGTRRRLPLFFIDVLIEPEDHEADRRAGAERNPGYVDRREFVIGGGMIAAAAAATYGYKKGMDAIEDALTTEGPKSILLEISKWVGSMAAGVNTSLTMTGRLGRDPSNPIGKLFEADGEDRKEKGFEDFRTKLRDLIFADKFVAALQICKEEMGIAEPTLAGFVGSAHRAGVREALAIDPEERRAFIRELASHIGQRQFDGYDGAEVMRRILREVTILPMLTWDSEKNDWLLTRYDLVAREQVMNTPENHKIA